MYTHVCCLAVEAGFNSDKVKCLPVNSATQVQFQAGAAAGQVEYFRSTTLISLICSIPLFQIDESCQSL